MILLFIYAFLITFLFIYCLYCNRSILKSHDSFKGELTRLTEENSELRSQNVQLSVVTDQFNKLAKTNSEYRVKIDDLEAMVESVKTNRTNELHRLKDTFDNCENSYKVAIEKLQAEISALESKNELLESCIEEVEDDLIKAKSLSTRYRNKARKLKSEKSK